MTIPQSSIIKISDTHSVVIDREAEIKVGDTCIDLTDNCIFRATEINKVSGLIRSESYTYGLTVSRKILFTIGVAIPGIPLLVEEDEAEIYILYKKMFPQQFDNGLSEEQMRTSLGFEIFEHGFRAARSKGTFTQEQVQLLLFKARTITHQHKSVDELISESHPPIKEIIIEEIQNYDHSKSIYPDVWQPKYFDKEKNIITCKFIR